MAPREMRQDLVGRYAGAPATSAGKPLEDRPSGSVSLPAPPSGKPQGEAKTYAGFVRLAEIPDAGRDECLLVVESVDRDVIGGLDSDPSSKT